MATEPCGGSPAINADSREASRREIQSSQAHEIGGAYVAFALPEKKPTTDEHPRDATGASTAGER